MRKALSTLLIISTLFCMIATMTGCGDKADYPAPLDVCAAYKGGEDVVGKTVGKEDAAEGTANDEEYLAHVFVVLDDQIDECNIERCPGQA